MNYLIIKTVRPEGTCWLDTIDDVPEDEDLWAGLSFAKRMPENASFKMSDNLPKDIRLADSLMNSSSLLVVSARVKNALDAVPGALLKNEVFPVKIRNHKGRVEKQPYFVIHQIKQIPCLDESKSVGKRNPLNPKRFLFLKTMVLEETAIDPKRMLFRATQFPEVALIRRDLADKLRSERFTGIEFSEIEGYAF